jgi:HEPN domain-containing protein
MRYGDDDLRLAKQALLMKSCPYKLAAFHAQQCAEKYLKAYLIDQGIDFGTPTTSPISWNWLRTRRRGEMPWRRLID